MAAFLARAMQALGEVKRQAEHGIELRVETTRPPADALRLIDSTAYRRQVPAASQYRVSGRVDGSAVRLTATSTLYSWQPRFDGVVLKTADGSAVLGKGTWSLPTVLFTFLFPAVGLVFILVGLTLGTLRTVQGRSSVGSLLAILLFGAVFGGGSLAMSAWGAKQAQRDMADLRSWLLWVLNSE